MKLLILTLLSMMVVFVLFVFTTTIILSKFPKDHWMRVFWEKHIATSEDIDPPTE